MAQQQQQQHMFCTPAPDDAVSRVQFLKSAAQSSLSNGDLLVSSWDGTVRLYRSQDGQLVSKVVNGPQPILSACSLNPVGSLSNDEDAGERYVAGGLSCEVLLGHFSRPDEAPLVLGRHDAPVRCVDIWSPDLVLSGSWDKSVKCWDVRAKDETAKIVADGKIFALAVSHKAEKLVICDSTKAVKIFDRRNLASPESVRDSTAPVLKAQFRAAECFPDGTGYAVASVEGRVAWEYFDPALGPSGGKKNYAFKCHREKGTSDGREVVYPVNALSFHHEYQSFATGGGDGGVITWDGYNKKRLWKSPELYEGSVTSLSFHPVEPTLAIGISDGKKELAKYGGCVLRAPLSYRPHVPGQVALRFLTKEDVTPKNKCGS